MATAALPSAESAAAGPAPSSFPSVTATARSIAACLAARSAALRRAGNPATRVHGLSSVRYVSKARAPASVQASGRSASESIKSTPQSSLQAQVGSGSERKKCTGTNTTMSTQQQQQRPSPPGAWQRSTRAQSNRRSAAFDNGNSLNQLGDAAGTEQLHIRDVVVAVITASSSARLPSAGT